MRFRQGNDYGLYQLKGLESGSYYESIMKKGSETEFTQYTIKSQIFTVQNKGSSWKALTLSL